MKVFKFDNGLRMESEILTCIFEDNRDIITIDFDDTLHEKTGIFKDRFKIFETLVKSEEYQVFILTSRSENIDDIETFLEKTNLKIRGIITNVDLKGDFLRNIAMCLENQKIVCHFEDDIDSSNDCVENEIPCFLTAESINKYYIDEWIRVLTENGEIEIYEKMGKVKKYLYEKENA